MGNMKLYHNNEEQTICVAPSPKGPYVGKIEIKFCIACCGGQSPSHFETKYVSSTIFD